MIMIWVSCVVILALPIFGLTELKQDYNRSLCIYKSSTFYKELLLFLLVVVLDCKICCKAYD